MNIFEIEVELNDSQTEAAVNHFEDNRVKNMVADIQGTVKSFFDQLAKEDEKNEEKPAKEAKMVFMTPVGIIEIEDDEDLYSLHTIYIIFEVRWGEQLVLSVHSLP